MLPSPTFDSPVDPLMSSNESVCDPKKRAGVHAFIKFVIEHQGGNIGRTASRVCGDSSGHNSGRAWDWMIRADVPNERASADELIDWLLADDAEMFRRAGLSYIIWDRKIWSAMRPNWNNYDGFDDEGNCAERAGCRDPHTSHVHFSFNWPGADGETSFYKWLASEQPVEPPNGKLPNGGVIPLPVPVASASMVPAVIAFAAGVGGAVWLMRNRGRR